MNTLADEFNIEETLVEIETFKDILKKIKEIPDPSLIVTATIEKASIFLDMVHSAAENGEMSPRYMEVASQLINTIITSSGFLSNETQLDFDNKIKTIKLKQKDRQIDLKQKELEIKELYYNAKSVNSDKNNVIIADQKSILKFLNEKNEAQ